MVKQIPPGRTYGLHYLFRSSRIQINFGHCQANQAHLPQLCFTGPRSQILVGSLHWTASFSSWGAIPHTLLWIPTKNHSYITRKAHLGLCLLLPLQTLPTIPSALDNSGSLGQQSILFPLSIPCPPGATGREQSSLSPATLQLPLKSTFGLKNILRILILLNIISWQAVVSSISARLSTQALQGNFTLLVPQLKTPEKKIWKTYTAQVTKQLWS